MIIIEHWIAHHKWRKYPTLKTPQTKHILEKTKNNEWIYILYLIWWWKALLKKGIQVSNIAICLVSKWVFPKTGVPQKWMIYNLLKWMIWGYHYFWKHPSVSTIILSGGCIWRCWITPTTLEKSINLLVFGVFFRENARLEGWSKSRFFQHRKGMFTLRKTPNMIMEKPNLFEDVSVKSQKWWIFRAILVLGRAP